VSAPDQRRRSESGSSTAQAPSATPDATAGAAGASTSDAAEGHAPIVRLTEGELASGRGSNKASEPGYRDPALVPTELSEDSELNEWMWAMMTTLRAAGNESDKLYPAGV
jgi:hypothetical protein